MIRRSVAALVLCLALPRLAAAQTVAYGFVPQIDDTVAVIDTNTRTVVATIPVGAVPTAAVPSPDGRWVFVTSNQDDTISAIDVGTRTVVGTMVLPAGPFSVAFSADARTAFVACDVSEVLVVIDVATRTVQTVVPVGDGATGVALSPDGLTAYVATFSGVVPVDLATSTAGAPVGSGPFADIAVAPNGMVAVATNFVDDVVAFIDLGTLTVGSTVPVGAGPFTMALSPDGRVAVTANTLDATASVIDMLTGTVVATVPVGAFPEGVSFTPDGQSVYVLNSDDDTASIIDVATRTVVDTIALGPAPVAFGGRFITPLLIAPAGSPFVADSDDAGLVAAGFARFVPFIGGTMQLTAGLGTLSTFSLQAAGGTVDTGGFIGVLSGGLVGPGTLTKTGAGGLGLNGPISHGGTVLTAGGLYVLGPHPSPFSITGGFLYATAAMGNITATGGTILPGGSGTGIMQAGAVTLGAGATLYLDLRGTDGPGAANGHDQLQASSLALSGATLEVQPWFTPAVGTSFVIATNATGAFAGLPEGGRVTFPSVQFAISYVGGDGNDVTLTSVNRAPSIVAPILGTGPQNTPRGPIAFTVADPDGNPATLVVTAVSSDQAIVPDGGIVLGGSGGARTITLTPRFGASGLVTITLTASDGIDTATTTALCAISGGTYHLAEGATGAFFDTDILIANPNAAPASISVHFLRPDGAPIVQTRTLPAMSRTTIAADEIPGLEAASFSTVVTSHGAVPLVVERTMRWGAGGYGAHGEKATSGPWSTWLFAEGAQGYFSTYFLLSNPQTVSNTAHVHFLREGAPMVTRDYTLAPGSRLTIDAGAISELRDTAFGTVVVFDRPGAAERAMYFGSSSPMERRPRVLRREWHIPRLVPRRGGDRLLLHDLRPAPQSVSGSGRRHAHVLPGRRRAGHAAGHDPGPVADHAEHRLEDPSLANAAVATRIASATPIVVERAQYWGTPEWIEAHSSAGIPALGTKWGLAEGRVGGGDGAQTYILLANPGAAAATVTVTFLREDRRAHREDVHGAAGQPLQRGGDAATVRCRSSPTSASGRS